jgi:hypothetical protein
MGDQRTTRTTDLTEREWTDDFGTHYEARIARPDGRVFMQKVTRSPISGWAFTPRYIAAENVRKGAETTP